MVNIYRDYSAGYFDLVITDECHRKHLRQVAQCSNTFDGIQVGLTATPCVKPPPEDGRTDSGDTKSSLRDTFSSSASISPLSPIR